MAQSDSGDEGDELEFDRTTDAGDEDVEADDDLMDNIEAEAGIDDVSDGDDESQSDDSEDGSDDDDDDDDSEHSGDPSLVDGDSAIPGLGKPSESPSPPEQNRAPSPPPPTRTRSLSPSQRRKKKILSPFHDSSYPPRSYTVEAICALPHPTPTHALASSLCMTHLLTGSDDGYIRDYDIFSAVNGKNFLTAPQRHHCGVVEGIMKAGQIRFWWENRALRLNGDAPGDQEVLLSPVYSLVMQSDALWSLAGSDTGHINLFTVRHEPGRVCYVMSGHRGPVSALSLQHDEKGFFSAGWDGEALQWDLDTGQIVRHFTAHGAQLATLAVRPTSSLNFSSGSTTKDSSERIADERSSTILKSQPQELDSKSDTSFDPLFDDEPDADGEFGQDRNAPGQPQMNGQSGQEFQPHASSNAGIIADPGGLNGQQTFIPQHSMHGGRGALGVVAPPKNAPPLLDSSTFAMYSPDILMTASIDGQVILWDRRAETPHKGIGRLWMSEKTPPWCLSACWSADGAQIYAGRRNGTIDVWDVRLLGRSGPNSTPRHLKVLRNPVSSGVVSCVVAFPDSRHIACASIDNIRLWNAAEAAEPDGSAKAKSGVQFKIIPGHHGGYISQMLVDPCARFLVSASSNRGWHGDSTRTVFVHDIKHVR